MIGVLKDIRIEGIAAAVPSTVEENAAAAAVLGDRRCKKQMRVTGIERRHISPSGQKMSDLCFTAAKKLMAHLSWKPEELKVVVLLTQNPDFAVPSTAFLLQKMLRIPSDCVAFDVNLGCSGFNVGLQIVASLLRQMPDGAKGLCVQGDLAFAAAQDGVPADAVASNLLFGSAASVAAMEKRSAAGDIPFATFSDGRRYTAILRHHGRAVSMEGEAVFNFSTNDVVDSIRAFMKRQRLSDREIDFYVFHQAQKLILDSIASECQISEEKELRSLTEYGNTSGASVPLSLCANRHRFKDRALIRVFSCGFGVGLSWSMAYSQLETKNILPVIFTDVMYQV